MTTNRTPTALVVQNGAGGGLGRWANWLGEAGLETETVPAYAGAPVGTGVGALPARLEHDALIVLGGGYMPDDDSRAPWLPAVRALARQALANETPYFGICLGGQLLAHVAGGEVRAEHGPPEAGSTRLRLRPEAAADPLLAGLPPEPRAIEHHVDAITALPPEAVWLAASDACPYQAFRLGSTAWGVQFHPEVGADRIATWDSGRLAGRGFDRDTLYAEALRYEDGSREVWRTVAQRFAALVRARHEHTPRPGGEPSRHTNPRRRARTRGTAGRPGRGGCTR